MLINFSSQPPSPALPLVIPALLYHAFVRPAVRPSLNPLTHRHPTLLLSALLSPLPFVVLDQRFAPPSPRPPGRAHRFAEPSARQVRELCKPPSGTGEEENFSLEEKLRRQPTAARMYKGRETRGS